MRLINPFKNNTLYMNVIVSLGIVLLVSTLIIVAVDKHKYKHKRVYLTQQHY